MSDAERLKAHARWLRSFTGSQFYADPELLVRVADDIDRFVSSPVGTRWTISASMNTANAKVVSVQPRVALAHSQREER